MVKISLNIVGILFVLFSNSSAISVPWNDHGDMKTLRLLQIVHTNGERTVLKDNMPKTDPFKNITFWKEGFGQLTKDGKSRMYRMGQNLREWYTDYLNRSHSPRLVYARSSIEHRCIESVSTLLSGMYPPESDWQWDSNGDDLGQKWQPFPVEAFNDDDTLEMSHKWCPKAEDERKAIANSEPVKSIINKLHNSSHYQFMLANFGEPIDTLQKGQMFLDTLSIEQKYKRIWKNFSEETASSYSQNNIIKDLEDLALGYYKYEWNRQFLLKIRLGKLIELLISNMKSVKVSGQTAEQRKELYIYSTHDSIVVPLMQALGQYHNKTPISGNALLFELHEQLGNFTVKIYHYNDTDSNPFPFLGIPKNLTFNEFESKNKMWYFSDFDKECGIESEKEKSLVLSQITFTIIGMAIGIALLGITIFVYTYIRDRKNTFTVNE